MHRLLPVILAAAYLLSVPSVRAQDSRQPQLFVLKDYYDPATRRQIRRQWHVYKVRGANNEVIRIQQGREDYFYRNGHGMQATFYREGKVHGPFIKWSPEGSILIKGSYEAGQKHGIFEYYREDGTLKLIAEFAQGARHGEITMYDTAGTPRIRANYRQGKRHGTVSKYYADKTLRESIEYNEGIKDGDERHLFFNGKPESQIQWKMGKKNGYEVYWHPTDGYRQFVFGWKDGKRHGPSIEYMGENKPRLVLTFNEGKLDGPVQVWTNSGKLMTDGVYRGGKPYTGIFRQPGDLPGQIFEYRYADGELVDGLFLIHGEPYTGDLVRHYTGTKVERVTPFVDGRLHGTEKTYFMNGTLRSEAVWHRNKLNGLYIEYYEDGQKGWEVAVSDGQRDGPETIWSERGFVVAHGINRKGKPYKGMVPVLITLVNGEQAWVIRNFRDSMPVAMNYVHPDLPTPDPQGEIDRPEFFTREITSPVRGESPAFNSPQPRERPVRTGDPAEPDENDTGWEVIEMIDSPPPPADKE